MTAFTWIASFGATKTNKPAVRATPFGDGYQQRVANGINTIHREWSVPFNNRIKTEADAIESFLDARGATETFTWTDPAGYAGVWVCDSWTNAPIEGGLFSVNATFRQVYGE